jgi:hypothetical protein
MLFGETFDMGDFSATQGAAAVEEHFKNFWGVYRFQFSRDGKRPISGRTND